MRRLGARLYIESFKLSKNAFCCRRGRLRSGQAWQRRNAASKSGISRVFEGMSFPDRISVIIPAHNAGRFVGKTLESLIAQTYGDVEIIVVDDASSDDTFAVASTFGDQVTLSRNERQSGVSASRNFGVSRSTGSWLAFLDADDWWPPTFLMQAAEQLRPGQALCYDNIIVDDPPGIAPAYETPSTQTLHRRALPWAQSTVERDNLWLMFDGAPLLKSIVHRTAFDAVGGFDTRFDGIEDFHFHVKLAVSNVKLLLVNSPAGYYRVHATQTTAAISGGKGRDPIRHLKCCGQWIQMHESIPKELGLDPRSVLACRARKRYWSYRYSREAILLVLRQRTWRWLFTKEFVSASWAALQFFLNRVGTRLGFRGTRQRRA
jgi:glycosyltransferase involved in cell wall biosynthesis